MFVLWTALAVLLLLATDGRERRTVPGLAKLLASLGFVAAGWTNGLLSGPVGTAVFVGLCLGALGDALLISREKRWFLLGIVAFLLNHVAYGVAFVLLGVAVAPTIVTGLLLAAIASVVWRWVGPRSGSLAPAVAAYILVISVMVALASGTGQPLLLLGATLFFVSDLAVARERFVQSAPINRKVGLPLYYAAQLVFAYLPTLLELSA